MKILRKQSFESVKEGISHNGLKKSLTGLDLFLLGIGAVVGTGIFVLTGTASQYSGPALILSFLFSGISCMFVALIYTEIAAMLPVAGSVYTYSYVAFGEIFAILASLLLMLEFMFGAGAVSAGWSGYVVDVLKQGGVDIPFQYTVGPLEGGWLNVPAMIIALSVTAILTRGTKESAVLNNILVAVKIIAIFLFLFIAAPHFDLKHWENFAPFGVGGITMAGAIVFFAFNGFDALATTAEECKDPKKDLTVGLIGSLFVCTILYMLVAGMLTGIVDFRELNNSKPLAHALRLNGSNIGSALVAAGGIAGMTTVVLAMIYAQSRVFLVMARDGLMPSFFAKLHTKYNTPYISTVLIGLTVSLIAGLVPIRISGTLTSMGTLAVFIMASVVVIKLRRSLPNVDRPFKCPAIYAIGGIAIVCCSVLLLKLIPDFGKYFFSWIAFGMGLYLLTGSFRTKRSDNS